jgi:hypothetical protein
MTVTRKALDCGEFICARTVDATRVARKFSTVKNDSSAILCATIGGTAYG